MEKCYGRGKDVSIAKERKQRRLLGSSAAERVVKSLIFFFQLEGLKVDSETLRRGYICRPCMRLIEKFVVLHEEVAGNVRKVLPLLSMSAGGTAIPRQYPASANLCLLSIVDATEYQCTSRL